MIGYCIGVDLNAENLAGSHKEHNTVIKVILFLPVFHFGIGVPFDRYGVKVHHPAINLRGMFDSSIIHNADQRMLRLLQAPELVEFTDSLYPFRLSAH